MFAATFHLGMIAAAAQAEADRAFERSLEGLDPSEAQRRRERREDQAAARARNERLARAIENSRPRGLGLFF